MKKILFLFPRLDVPFKNLGPISDVRGPIVPIRQHWENFRQQVCEEYVKRGYSIDVIERPLWQFENEELQQYLNDATNATYDYVFIPHKEFSRFPIHGYCTPLYYMQTQFPWMFSVDPKGWGSGASAYPFKGPKCETSAAFDSLRARCLTGESKFGQPPLGTNIRQLPTEPFLFFPCQLPHDETIKYHSTVSVEDALRTTCEAARDHNMPLVIKGHPVNPGSMEPLKRIVQSVKNAGYILWLDDLNIQDALERAAITVTVNSGVGFESLLHGTPVITFGYAEYDVVSSHASDKEMLDVSLKFKAYSYPNPEVYGFFEHWHNWCYDTTNRASFSKLPS